MFTYCDVGVMPQPFTNRVVRRVFIAMLIIAFLVTTFTLTDGHAISGWQLAKCLIAITAAGGAIAALAGGFVTLNAVGAGVAVAIILAKAKGVMVLGGLAAGALKAVVDECYELYEQWQEKRQQYDDKEDDYDDLADRMDDVYEDYENGDISASVAKSRILALVPNEASTLNYWRGERDFWANLANSN